MSHNQPYHILLVDDDPVLQSLVSQALKQAGFQLTQALSGKAALEAIERKAPDLVILDVILPDIDGTDIAGLLQEKIETAHIPIIYLTSLADKATDLFSHYHNPDIILTKPVDVSLLLSKINEVMSEIKEQQTAVFKDAAAFDKKSQRKRILVVDDDAYILDLLESRLSYHGYDVLCAVNGKNALLKAKQHIPDLIILDVMLPGIDGTEVARILREDPKTKNIPIIYVTALKSDNDQPIIGALDKSTILPKPFDSKVLIKKIEELIYKPGGIA